MNNLDLTELSDNYVPDSYTIEDIRTFAMDAIKFYKNLRGELVKRLETGKPFNNAPTGINNPESYKFLFEKLLKLAHMFEENEMKFKLKKERWQYIKENQLPWTETDIVDVGEVERQIEDFQYNSRLTRKRIEILEILRKEYCNR